MNYREAMEFLEETKKYGSQLGLTSICALMEELDNVQEKVPVVHIGGTNGKGSVGAMLSSVFEAAGYRVARFATPDVFCYEEEFLMNGVPIAQARLAQLFTKVAEACARMRTRGLAHPTRFEVETAAAYLWFFEEKCDVALVEVGMGGATDATNLITKPLLSILTSISMDHMGFLGDTIAKIAGVKAGIIKENCPVVTVRQKPEAMQVIRETCQKKHSRCICADSSEAMQIQCTDNRLGFSWKPGSELPDSQETKGSDKSFPMGLENLTLGLRGTFQIENAVCVLRALEVLQKNYPQIDEAAIRKGLAQAHWKGRFEQIGSQPDFYLDGAHNEGAVRQLKKTLELSFPGRRILYIMGVLGDKEFSQMADIMFSKGDLVYTVTPKNPRALNGAKLAQLLQKKEVSAAYCENMSDAVSLAVQGAKKNDVILAFGSLSYLRDIREIYESLTK